MTPLLVHRSAPEVVEEQVRPRRFGTEISILSDGADIVEHEVAPRGGRVGEEGEEEGDARMRGENWEIHDGYRNKGTGWRRLDVKSCLFNPQFLKRKE